jgi:hypothetical protein
VELRLGVEPSHYEPGAGDTGRPATTGADAGPATGKTADPSDTATGASGPSREALRT